MKFFLQIILKLLTISNSFLLNVAEHENFSANKYENEIFMLSWVKHEKGFMASDPDFWSGLAQEIENIFKQSGQLTVFWNCLLTLKALSEFVTDDILIDFVIFQK